MNVTQSSPPCVKDSKNKHLKIFVKDTFVYGVGNITVRACSFLLIPLYTHSLSVRDYGLLAILTTTIEILFIIGHIGLRTGVLRFTKECEENGTGGKLIGTAVVINAISGTILTVLSLLLFEPVFKNLFHMANVGEYIVLANLSAFTYSLFILTITYYRARNESRKYVMISALAALILLSSNFMIFHFLSLGVKGVLIAQVFTYSKRFRSACWYWFRRANFNWDCTNFH